MPLLIQVSGYSGTTEVYQVKNCFYNRMYYGKKIKSLKKIYKNNDIYPRGKRYRVATLAHVISCTDKTTIKWQYNLYYITLILGDDNLPGRW